MRDRADTFAVLADAKTSTSFRAWRRPWAVPYPVKKRILDIALAVPIGLVVAPVVLLAAAFVVCTSPGNPFYVQTRVGHEGRTFSMLKIRTMVRGADQKVPLDLNQTGGPTFKAFADPRITRIGKWLRRSSIDELPQLWNVIRGDLSLVGPRPALPAEVALYSPSARRRLSVKPGLTAIWQVSGRSQLTFRQMVAMDRLYIRKQSFWFDVYLLLRTPVAVIRMRGAH